MNGYGYQLYSELRYWHPLLAAEVPGTTDTLSVFGGQQYMQGDVPRCDFDYAAAGTLPDVEDLPDSTGMQATSIPGQGVPQDVAGTWTPQAYTLSDTVDVWTAGGEVEYDFTPSDTKYTIEIRDADFNLLANVSNYMDGSCTLALGKTSDAWFEIAYDDPAYASVNSNNYFIIRNARGLIIDQFSIQKTKAQ